MADPTHPGVDWKALLGLIAPVVGTITSRGGGADGAFMQGWQQSHHAIQQETLRQQQEQQRKSQAGADYLLKIGEHAQGLEDPIDFQNFVQLAEDAGIKAGYTKPGELSSKLQFSTSKLADRRLKELTDQLNGLEAGHYDLNALAESGQFLETKDGKRVPISEALKLTRRQPLDATGNLVAPPKKADVNATTDYSRFLAKYAKDNGKTVDQLTAQDELDAKDVYAKAGRTPPDPALADMHKTLTQLQIDSAQQRLADAKKNATPTAIVPGSKEYRVAQDLAYGKLTMAQFRSLYSFSRDINSKTSIYDKAAELNPDFNPAAFEMGFTLAKSPKVQQQLASMDNVMEAIPDLIAASDAAQRSGVTFVNQFASPIRVAIGNKKFSNLKIARTAFADELSGALGFGSATDMSREMGLDMTDPNLSPENFASAMRDVVVPFIQRKRGTLLKQMGPYGQPGFNPAASVPPAAPATAPQPTHRFNPATGTVEPIH